MLHDTDSHLLNPPCKKKNKKTGTLSSAIYAFISECGLALNPRLHSLRAIFRNVDCLHGAQLKQNALLSHHWHQAIKTPCDARSI